MEEYHRDMEVALTRPNILESNEATMTRFLHKLNRDIFKATMNKEKEERPRKNKSPKKRSTIPQGRKEERMLPSPTPASKGKNIKCFKCLDKGHIASHYPNKRSMIMQEHGTIDSDSSRAESSSISDSNASN
ncbi:hypothetical protein CR513_01767, partial [Mucuna pruriens]